MCNRSPTFEQQITRLGREAGLTIVVHANVPSGSRPQAWTTITRVDHLRVRADVWMVYGPEATELLAHELEHIIEWLEGVNLGQRPKTGQKGIALNATGHIAETSRAMRVGQAVAREVASSHVLSRGDCRTF